MQTIKKILRWLLIRLYKVEICGIENYHAAGKRVMIVANHTSYLDALLLAVFLPDNITFAINTYVAKTWWVRPFLVFVKVFPMDPTNPLSSKALIRYLQKDNIAVIFPEGRITVTGALMKIYDGPGLVADRADANVLPIRIDGAQYTPFSRMGGRVRRRWFPKIRINILAARKVSPGAVVEGRDRRQVAGQLLADLMTNMMFETSNYRRTLFSALLDARAVHGGSHVVMEDIQRKPCTYNQLIARCLVIGNGLKSGAASGEAVGLLLPNTCAAVAVFFGMQAFGLVPAMINYSIGFSGVRSACTTAGIKTIVTSRRFIKTAKLEDVCGKLAEIVNLVYLEDLQKKTTLIDKLLAVVRARFVRVWLSQRAQTRKPDDPAVILFTSGSEDRPKGVVLSHTNLMANREQLAARIDFNAQDTVLNALPMFHSFGLTAATLLPILSGIKVFFYPSPLHYRIVPEIAYEISATIMFGTNTFLNGYARYAHPYDFYSVRYVFAGAEKLLADTRETWSKKFGIRIFEGYGATETSPALAANTAIESKEGTVGRLLPGIAYRLLPVPGIEHGGRLHVRGPNIMVGYYLPGNPGQLVPPRSEVGEGWYDTGDIVSMDDDGFIKILGRAKRFAKIGGEMVSLTAVEEIARTLWPGAMHAAVAIADARKGEQIILITDQKNAERRDLADHAKRREIGEINLPKQVLAIPSVPLLGTGKINYPAVEELARETLRV